MKNSQGRRGADGVDLLRRRSFSQLLGNLLVGVEELRGHPHCAFQNLETLPKDRFLKLIPKASREFQFRPVGKWLAARNRNTGDKIRLFELHTENTTAFNLMNGTHTVEMIVAELSFATNWEPERAYEHVRNQVLRLVQVAVFTFASPLEY